MKKLFYILFLFVILISCKKEPISIGSEESVQNKNGILSFKSVPEFLNVVDSLNKLSRKEAKMFKAEDGFLSLLAIEENYSECLQAATDKSTYDKIITDHLSFLIKGDSTQFRIRNKVLYPVLNKDGIVQIGNILYKFTEDCQILSLKNDYEQIIAADVSDEQTDNLIIIKYPEMVTGKGACGNFQNSGWIYNGDRRCYVASWVELDFFMTEYGYYSVTAYVRIEGRSQKNGLFGWRDYNTLNWLDYNYKATLNNGYSRTTSGSKTEDNVWMVEWIENIYTGTTTNPNQWPYQGIFNWINQNVFTNRGMNGVTAVNECDEYGK